MSAPRIPPSSPTDTARPGVRAKTVATRLSPEELQEVENAAERDGKSLAEWLRKLALRSARERPADPIEQSWANIQIHEPCERIELHSVNGFVFGKADIVEGPRPGTGSLPPVAIGAAVEANKAEASGGKGRIRRLGESAGCNPSER
jgi:hypothetical protein